MGKSHSTLICLFKESAFEFTLTLLVNKFSWSYHKVALDLWGSRIWLNVSIFYQFHKAKSRYLSSEPGHWFKKQLSKFSWNQSKDLTFAQIFAFCDLNVIFDNSNWIEPTVKKELHCLNDMVFDVYAEDLKEKLESPEMIQKGRRKYYRFE